MKITTISCAFAAMLAFPAPTLAEPSFGFGLTYVFGEGLAVGARVFSTDRRQSGALALGIDYKFSSGTWRPSVGIAYLDDDVYMDFSVGVDIQSGIMDYGIGIGGLGGMESTSTASAPPPPPPASD